MSSRIELNSYIARLQQRLRVKALLRGIAVLVASAIAVTVVLVWVLNRIAFPVQGTVVARWAMLTVLAIVAALALAWPVLRLKQARAVHQAEAAHPDLEGRLTTFHERDRDDSDPFLELLAVDTLSHTKHAEVSTLVPDSRLFALAGAGCACVGVLVWMIFAGPGYLGYGASLLWTGAKKNAAPLYYIAVTPGDVAVRRNSDQLIVAQIKGTRPEKVQIFAHYASAAGWEPVAMQAQQDLGGAATYQFLFAGLPENVEYYAAAGPLVSPHYKIRVVDLPSVKSIRVTYHYPKWTGMKAVTEEHSGDLRALEGTDATIEVEMDRPLKDGQLMLDGGQTIHLAGGDAALYQGTIHMEKDGAYHVAAVDGGQPVRLSEDYFIATDKPSPPEIAIDRPGRDYRASPIEEVTVGVKAADNFGLNDVKLHYSVNGGADKSVDMLKSAGAKEADGTYTIRLEDFKLVPGDVVSLYATARDGHADARTDITFVQAEPFEREFTQSQQEGGAGGGGGQSNNQTEMSKREKELIAATWKQQNDKAATEKDAVTQAAFLADAQSKLRDQVLALSARMQSRDLSAANEEFNSFEKDMQDAASAMMPSADKLKGKQWSDAIPNEQKALQYLLRAEATFRQIEIAFSQSGGGGGGGGSAGRDLASLFDLELDTEKNQYETAQSASTEEQHAKDVESALEKLDALAKRQEELAGRQHDPQQSFQERWQQEMLRREAEQLQRQMEQLAQNQQGQQSGQEAQGSSGQQSSQSGSQPSGSSWQQASAQSGSEKGVQGESGSQNSQSKAGSQSSSQDAGNAGDQRITQALNRLRQAGDAMKRGGSQQNSDAAKQAADRLREATNLLGGTQQQLASGKLDGLSHEASRLSQQERAQSDRIDQLVNQQKTAIPSDRESMMARLQQRDQLAGDRQQLSDDLSKLQKNLRDAAREMAPNQRDTAQKLRDALTQMDQSDLDNHVQRTADWLRRGINPNSNGTETEIAQGLQKLDQQLRQAQQGTGQGQAGKQRGSSADQVSALGQVERLRSQIEAMAAARGNTPPGQNDQQGNTAEGQRNGNAMARAGQNGQGTSQGGSVAGQAGADMQGRGNGTNRSGSNPAGGHSGDVRVGGTGGGDGTVWGNINTGNNQYGQSGQQPAPLNAAGNPADTERNYQQGVHELNALRQMVQGDPQAAREVQELAQQMQKLDPSRFPGNPAMVEQMHREVLSEVDKLELRLSRDDAANDARTGKPYVVPSGYQDSVAEYYRRLSNKQ